jgi:hypothetical protein
MFTFREDALEQSELQHHVPNEPAGGKYWGRTVPERRFSGRINTFRNMFQKAREGVVHVEHASGKSNDVHVLQR